VLLDSGSDGDILFQQRGKISINVPYVHRLTPMVWLTSMGTFSTEKLGRFELTFPEYSGSKRIALSPDIVEYDSNDYEPKFDLIIGTETMSKLGIVLDFKFQMIEIDQIDLPMRKLSELQSKPKKSFQTFTNSYEPTSTAELTKRTVRILDAKYEKADLPAIVEKCDHLTKYEKEKLLQLLRKYECLFDGTLGEWKTTPVKLRLQKGAKPFHVRPFPIPRVHRETLKKKSIAW